MVNDKKRLVILDTHAILHRAYHALPDFSSSKGEPTGGLYGLISMLIKIITELKPDYIVAAFDLPEPTHRHLAFESYKSQRVAADDALVAQIIRSKDVLEALGIVRYECPGFEADDVIGTIVEELHTKEKKAGRAKDAGIDIIIASGDMDTLQLVDDDRVRVYTLRKGLSDTVLYDEKTVVARYGFGPERIADFKGLRGDPSDNIPGVKGVGEKTATALIAAFGSVEHLYEVIRSAPEKLAEVGVKGLMLQKLQEQQEQAEFSKELAIIRRDAPIRFVLPPPWREHVSFQKTLAMLEEFEFRSLIPRIRKLIEPGLFEDTTEIAADAPQVLPEVPKETFDAAALAVWVLDSNLTQPTLDDIYRVGRSTDFETAQKNIAAQITENNLTFIFEKIEQPLTPILRAMEQVGIAVDRAFLKDLSVTYTAELAVLAQRIYAAAGQEFNINSPKQLGGVLFDTLGLAVKNQKKTATGQRTTRESELEKMRDMHPIIADILSYRELQKLLSTYIDTIPTLLDQGDRLHTSYVQTGTTTGRLSSQNPNLQNIPIKTELGRAIRHAFVATPGMELVSFDYSQIELRIAAFLSEDEALVDIFRQGRDVHREVAMRVFGVASDEVTYEQRRRAKVINFGILYGMGVNALRDALGTTRGEAQEFYDQYFAAFPKLAQYLEDTKADAARLGYTTTYFGRRRYVPGITSPIPYVRASAERMAINAPVQGTAADMLKLAMVELARVIKDEHLEDEVRLLLQVHDELVLEIKKDAIGAAVQKIKDSMEQVLTQKEAKGIPFVVEGKHGTTWGDMTPL